jgi:hypothetical protein
LDDLLIYFQRIRASLAVKEYADLGVVFCEVVGIRHSGKMAISAKKGQAETYPPPQKEAK